MPIETDDDRRLFVQADDFAVAVAWVHADGTAHLPAIFDEDYQLVTSAYLDGGAEGATPQIHACGADIPAAGGLGDTVTVRGRQFSVVEIKPDGTGMAVVRLQEN